MLRGVGAGLIVCAALLTRRAMLGSRAEAQRTRRALAAAFETMASEIRALLTPLPALLRRGFGAETEAFFSCLAAALRHGDGADAAWRAAAETLPLSAEEKEVLALLGGRLGGDEDSVCAALSLAAQTLRAAYEEAERRRAQEDRLVTALCLSAGLLLVILLV